MESVAGQATKGEEGDADMAVRACRKMER